MQAKGVDVKAEIMVPLVGTVREFNAQADGHPQDRRRRSSPSAARPCTTCSAR